VASQGLGQLGLQQRDMPYYQGYLSFEGYMKLLTIDDPQAFARAVVAYVRKAAPNYRSGIVPVVLGCDHAPPHVNLVQALKIASEIQDDILFQTGSPEKYIRLVQAAETEKPVLRQELLGTRFQYILLGALSTRSYLKRENFAAEAILEKYAEPLEALASLAGGRSDGVRQLDEAWHLLLTNQAHDSIHGSSTDEVHAEMQARNGIIRQIGAGVAHNALSDIGRQALRW
jgi:alpha-mannosidase